ncbi:GntR family transcriptional regulator [Luedemannella flava]|uniref:GntR family transcriptional regulator n=1 Tax=Luedemannella flava TaxID=349316 RepID=A0ABN2MPJ7_9ACTN
MIVEVDPASAVPPYEQIRAQLATMISTGTLPVGAQLPPIRQLAADLGIAANTVARSYRELESQGLVTSRVRHGTTVADQAARLTEAEIRSRLDEAAHTYAALARQLGVSDAAAADAVHAALAVRAAAR